MYVGVRCWELLWTCTMASLHPPWSGRPAGDEGTASLQCPGPHLDLCCTGLQAVVQIQTELLKNGSVGSAVEDRELVVSAEHSNQQVPTKLPEAIEPCRSLRTVVWEMSDKNALLSACQERVAQTAKSLPCRRGMKHHLRSRPAAEFRLRHSSARQQIETRDLFTLGLGGPSCLGKPHSCRGKPD